MYRACVQDDIPDGYRLVKCEEFKNNRDACLAVMSDWAICLLTGAPQNLCSSNRCCHHEQRCT